MMPLALHIRQTTHACKIFIYFWDFIAFAISNLMGVLRLLTIISYKAMAEPLGT